MDYHWQLVQLVSILKSLSNIVSYIWIPIHQIILGSCNRWKMIMGTLEIILFPLGMHFEPYHLEIYLTSCCYGFFFKIIYCYKIQSLSFVCTQFELLFVDHVKMFVAMKGRKRCCLMRFFVSKQCWCNCISNYSTMMNVFEGILVICEILRVSKLANSSFLVFYSIDNKTL